MSLSITSTTATLPLMGPNRCATSPAQDPADIKAGIMAKMDDRQDRITSRVETVFDKAESRLGALQQYADDNDYSKLAVFANKAGEAVSTAGTRVTDQIGKHYDLAEKLVEKRPQGGYSISEETAAALSGHVEQHTQNRLAGLLERSINMNEHLAKLEQKAINHGHDGEHIAARSDRVETRLENTMERVSHLSEKALEIIQSRINAGYEVPPDSVDNKAGEHTDVEA